MKSGGYFLLTAYPAVFLTFFLSFFLPLESVGFSAGLVGVAFGDLSGVFDLLPVFGDLSPA